MDIFCQFKEKFPDQIIEETKHFYLIHDGFPLAEGHLMIIPIKHESCFLDIKGQARNEFLSLKERVIEFLTRFYHKPKLFEHGGIIQTVPHAHLHFLPTEKSMLHEILPIANIMKSPKVPYLYYQEDDKEYYFLPKITLAPGFFHQSFAKLLNRPTMAERQKDGKNWILKIKTKWQHG